MILDSSAIIAVLRDEPEAVACAEVIDTAPGCRLSAVNFLETAIVFDAHRDPVISRRLDEFLRKAGVVIEPVTEEQALIARQAYRDFGKGSGHPAKLNFGDCFAFALAAVTGEELLFKGNDFCETNIANIRLDRKASKRHLR
jgi:ribonuclease VapC